MNGHREIVQRSISLSLVIPTYGRGASLSETITEMIGLLRAQRETVDISFEIILVDDASPDDTSAVLRNLCARYPEVRGAVLAANCGQQNATLAGIRMAEGTWVVTMDDDRKNDVRDIPRLLAELAAGCDVVYGVPAVESQARMLRRFGTRVKEHLLRRICGKPSEIRLTSFRAMNRRTADRVSRETRSKAYVSATLLLEPVRIGQVPVWESLDAVSASGYKLPALVAQLWHIAVQYGRGPFARLFRKQGEPCPIKETFG